MNQFQPLTTSLPEAFAGNLIERYLNEAGNSEGAKKGWETRRKGYHERVSEVVKGKNYAKLQKLLKRDMSDAEVAKLLKSKADIHIPVGGRTGSGRIASAFFSNDKKHAYVGKTIGMRSKVISDYHKMGQALPEGFENLSFRDVNKFFKKHLGEKWYEKRQQEAGPIRKLYIKGINAWRKARQTLGKKFTSSSAPINESATMILEPTITEPVTSTCLFLEGEVSSPRNCGCDDCLAIVRHVGEEKKALTETSVTSFGQNLRAEETNFTPDDEEEGDLPEEEGEEDPKMGEKKKKEEARRRVKAVQYLMSRR